MLYWVKSAQGQYAWIYGHSASFPTGACVEVHASSTRYRVSTLVPVEEADAKKLLRLIDALDDLDDVQAVFSNYDIEDEVMEKVLAEV